MNRSESSKVRADRSISGIYAHAKPFNRANKALRKRRTQLERVMRDIRRKISDDEALMAAFHSQLSLDQRVLTQRQRGQKVDSVRAPEVEWIGKGKPHKPISRMSSA